MEAEIAHLKRELDGARRQADQDVDAKTKLASDLQQTRRANDGLQRDLQLAKTIEKKLRGQLQAAKEEITKRREAHNRLTAERDQAQAD